MQVYHRRAHAWIWAALSVLLAIGFVTGLAVRQDLPIDTTPIPPAPANKTGEGTR